MKLKDMNAIVTGGSRGLGAALARELARRGARVVIVARDPRPLREVADSIRARGGTAFALPDDVADPDAAARIAGAAAALAGPVDLVVHNASSLGALPMPALADTPEESFEQVLQANLVGPFRLTRALVGSMVLRGRGTIVDISSDAAVEPYPGWGAYGVSKAALDHLGRIWGAELEGTGVRVLSIDPGEMDTRMHADAIPGADPATLRDPADVARAVADLIERAGELPNGARLAASLGLPPREVAA